MLEKTMNIWPFYFYGLFVSKCTQISDLLETQCSTVITESCFKECSSMEAENTIILA